MVVDCTNTVKLVMRIIKHYMKYKVGRGIYSAVFIDTVMVGKFIRRLNCNRKPKSLSKIVSKTTHALACLAVRYGGFFTINGNQLFIYLPIKAISKARKQELMRTIYECTKKRAWHEIKKAKKVL